MWTYHWETEEATQPHALLLGHKPSTDVQGPTIDYLGEQRCDWPPVMMPLLESDLGREL